MELLEFMYGLLIGVPLFVLALILAFVGSSYFFTVVAFQIVCVALAPVAGLIFALNTRNKGIGVWRRLFIGATYSALLLLPWVYLLRQVRGGRIRFQSIQLTYRRMYALWLCFIASSPGPILALGFMNVTGRMPIWFPIFASVLTNSVIWMISTRYSSRIPFDEDEAEEFGDSHKKVIPEHIYMAPFAHFSAAIVSTPLVLLVASGGFL